MLRREEMEREREEERREEGVGKGFRSKQIIIPLEIKLKRLFFDQSINQLFKTKIKCGKGSGDVLNSSVSSDDQKIITFKESESEMVGMFS